MKTSKQWWDEVKNDSVKTERWLRKQWRGEVTAAVRIERLANQYTELGSHERRVLCAIAIQEAQHAEWVRDLLITRGIFVSNATLHEATSRYWAETLPGIKDFATGTAVAAHAEKMRLERIQVIVDDEESDEDVREVFAKILKDELWHERAFRELSTSEALAATAGDYKLGREALGLVA